MYDNQPVRAITDAMGAQVVLKSLDGNKLSQDFITHGEAVKQATLLVEGKPNSIKWHTVPLTLSDLLMAVMFRPPNQHHY